MDWTQLGYTGNEDGQDEKWGQGSNSGSFSGEIKTDFILGSSTTMFSGIRKSLWKIYIVIKSIWFHLYVYYFHQKFFNLWNIR